MAVLSISKTDLRKEAKEKLATLLGSNADFRKQKSQAVIESLITLPQFDAAQNILLYYPLDDELDLTSLIVNFSEKNWILPRAIGEGRMLLFGVDKLDNLNDSKYGIKVPPATNNLYSKDEVDMVVVPALAYDTTGFRLGRGAGYYDRLLAHFRASLREVSTVGVCLKELVLKELPVESHDIPVDILLKV